MQKSVSATQWAFPGAGHLWYGTAKGLAPWYSLVQYGTAAVLQLITVQYGIGTVIGTVVARVVPW